MRWRLRRWWYNLRYEYFYINVRIGPAPPQDVDATPMIQAAIDEAHHSRHGQYEIALQRYESRRFKFLHRKPILKRTVVFGHDVYRVAETITLNDNRETFK